MIFTGALGSPRLLPCAMGRGIGCHGCDFRGVAILPEADAKPGCHGAGCHAHQHGNQDGNRDAAWAFSAWDMLVAPGMAHTPAGCSRPRLRAVHKRAAAVGGSPGLAPVVVERLAQPGRARLVDLPCTGAWAWSGSVDKGGAAAGGGGSAAACTGSRGCWHQLFDQRFELLQAAFVELQLACTAIGELRPGGLEVERHPGGFALQPDAGDGEDGIHPAVAQHQPAGVSTAMRVRRSFRPDQLAARLPARAHLLQLGAPPLLPVPPPG